MGSFPCREPAGPPCEGNSAAEGPSRERAGSHERGDGDGLRGAEAAAEREWGNGPYQRITETITELHDAVVERLAPQPGDRWLDLACGTGAVSERAAAAGATVTGIDLAPGLIETAQERAAELGLEIDYRVGDAERLDLPDASFGKVSSTVGVMFAPDHEAVAGQLARVTKPGGQIALASWTPTGGIGRMFKVMAPYQPVPPPSSPFDWGVESRVRELLGESFELEVEERVSTLRVPSAGGTGSSSRRATARRRRSRSRSATAGRNSTATGSTSSRRITARTERSRRRASTCSCSAGVARSRNPGSRPARSRAGCRTRRRSGRRSRD
jgi:SAM-dependent methyltransferase